MRRILMGSLTLAVGLLLLTSGLRAQTASQVQSTLTSGAGTCGVGNAGGPGCLLLPMLGFSAVTIQLAGTWSGVVAVEGSVNGVEPFIPVAMTPWGATSGAPQQLLQNNGIWTGSFPGFVYIRASMDSPNGGAYISGTVSVTMRAVAASLPATTSASPAATAAVAATPTRALPLPLCNPVARFTLCSPKGF